MGAQEHRIERRLVAIFAADVAGYSRLMSQDEVGTLRSLTVQRETMDRLIGEHGGRIANTAGDSVLAEFPSAVNAVECAIEIQKQAAESPSGLVLRFRIAVHVGDVMVRGGDLFGDGVNIAARLQALSAPGGVCLSGAAYEHLKRAIPLELTDLGPQQVKNIDEPVRAYSLKSLSPPGNAPLTPPLPDKPSIAVLPFDNIGHHREGEFLADGIVEDIIAALSRIRSFFVIARNSTFTYKEKSVTVQQISRELGVRYVLEGSVRRVRDRVRITAQLVEGSTGAHLWADHYDGTIEDIFDLQDRITASVIGFIQPSIRAAEIERARRKRPDSLDAYDLVMQALPSVWSLDKASNATATALLARALRLDPHYPLALALSAWCCGQRVVYNWSADPNGDTQEALDKAQAARDLATEDPFVLTVLGAGLTITRQFASARLVIDRALALDPNSAWTWNRSGWLFNYLDDPEAGIKDFEKALRLSPFDPMLFNSYVGIAAAHFMAERYDLAVEWYERALLTNPKAIWINRILAPSYAFAGKQKEAEAAARKLQDAYPGVTARAMRDAHLFSERILDRITDGLRRAGFPD